MIERPSTSDGPRVPSPGPNQFRFENKNYSKRVSRDDSFLNTRQHVAGFDFRPYGNLRAQQATPELSPLSTPAPASAVVPPIRMPTLQEGGEIGMALGSPGHASWNMGSPNTAPKTKQAISATSSGAQGARPPEPPAPKKQPGKWKLFGMFGRKHDPAPANTEWKEVRGSPQPEQKTAAAPQSRSPAKMERSLTSASRKTPKHRPLVPRTNTLPFSEGTGIDDQPWIKERRPEADKSIGNTPAAVGSTPSLTKGPLLNVAIPTVELERYSVMFSSVLGEQGSKQSSSNLLARRQAALQELRSIDDAKLHEQGQRQLQPQIIRRATSPQPEASPSYDQFPSPPVSQESQQSRRTPHRLAPIAGTRLARSNTSPAMLPSPLRPTFDSTPVVPEESSPSAGAGAGVGDKPLSYNHLRDPVKGNNPRAKLTIATLAKARETTSTKESSPQGPLSPPRSHRFDPEASSLILESSTDEGEDVSEGVSHHHHRTPKPQTAQKAPSTASSSASSSIRKGSPTSSSLLAARTTTPQTQSDPDSPDRAEKSGVYGIRNDDENDRDRADDDDDDDEVVITKDMSPVEASIARQISVSRQQRRLLRPLHSQRRNSNGSTSTSASSIRPAAAAAAAAIIDPAKMVGVGIGIGSGGRSPNSPAPSATTPTKMMSVKKKTSAASMGMVETKTATPTLVVPGAAGSDDRLRIRRSERVVLEAA